MLVIADHGKGWEGMIEDETHKGWMSVPQLKQALGYRSAGHRAEAGCAGV
jgi:hypothetical protein